MESFSDRDISCGRIHLPPVLRGGPSPINFVPGFDGLVSYRSLEATTIFKKKPNRTTYLNKLFDFFSYIFLLSAYFSYFILLALYVFYINFENTVKFRK